MERQKNFLVKLDQLQPSQPYLSKARMENITHHLAFLEKPVPVRKIDGRICIVEGHERCFALLSAGRGEISAYLDDNDRLSEKAFEEFVHFTCDCGVSSLNDLEDKVVDSAHFKQLWLSKKKEILNKHAKVANAAHL
ncbi:MAG: hypothetical protein ACQETH_14000 [Candidatus Rifleibacteriota bacterium]